MVLAERVLVAPTPVGATPRPATLTQAGAKVSSSPGSVSVAHTSGPSQGPSPVIVHIYPDASPIAIIGLVIAVLTALAQFGRWFIEWRKTRNVLIERSGAIEINYNAFFGSSIGLKGVLFSENKKSLVTGLRASIALDGQTSRQFNLQLFRDPKIIIGPAPQTVIAERAGPFVIEKDDAYPYYATFVDVQAMHAMGDIQVEFLAAWTSAVEKEFAGTPMPATDADKAQRSADFERLYVAFIANDPTNSTKRLSDIFYWLAGAYTFHVECDVKHDKRLYLSENWRFDLLKVSEDRLRSNIKLIQRAWCGMPLANFQQVIAEYS